MLVWIACLLRCLQARCLLGIRIQIQLGRAAMAHVIVVDRAINSTMTKGISRV